MGSHDSADHSPTWPTPQGGLLTLAPCQGSGPHRSRSVSSSERVRIHVVQWAAVHVARRLLEHMDQPGLEALVALRLTIHRRAAHGSTARLQPRSLRFRPCRGGAGGGGDILCTSAPVSQRGPARHVVGLLATRDCCWSRKQHFRERVLSLRVCEQRVHTWRWVEKCFCSPAVWHRGTGLLGSRLHGDAARRQFLADIGWHRSAASHAVWRRRARTWTSERRLQQQRRWEVP